VIPTYVPHAPPPSKLPEFDGDAALALAQSGLDQALAWPRWTVFALLGFALALMLLGRQGQRLLAGSSLGGAVVAFALLVLLPNAPHEQWPGLVAVIGGGAMMALGIGLPGLATAAVASAALGGLGAFIALRIAQVPWMIGAIPGALLGLFMGLANHLFWGLWMPPLAAAFSVTLACARLAGASPASAPMIPELAKAPYVLGLFAGLVVAMLAISLEREHRRRTRLSTKTREESDRELKGKLKRDRERHDKHLGIAKKS